MSILPLLIVGIAAVAIACYAHSLTDITVVRSKFVFVSLASAGTLSLMYVAAWVVANQHPGFSLAPFAIFGCTMWVTALAYSALVVLCLKDTAPSH